MLTKPMRPRSKSSFQTKRSESSIKVEKDVLEFATTREVRCNSSCSHSRQSYNKYYIRPEQRFRTKPIEPKSTLLKYADQDFFYKNLQNRELWNQTHPIYFSKLKARSKLASNKLDIHMEQIAGKRVPLIIMDYLQKHAQNK